MLLRPQLPIYKNGGDFRHVLQRCSEFFMLCKRLIKKKELLDYCAQRQGRGKANALRALNYATGRTENGGEAYALGVMLDGGLAQPSLQEEITYPFDLGHRDRVDFAWHTREGHLIVAELDGRVKYRDPSMFRGGDLSATIIAEKEREERIRLVADEVVRFSFREAMERQPLIRKLIHAGVPVNGAL
ncbi:hypothetical protein [Bifidobacterium imperatoris]|nr:hypothetical protein [Bifidobacterium imperatoris]